ncbi:hypothetical protein CDAR_547961 [Caerostris darwini]|uniref:Uncharacterized protein n=1 Tax=Caerostris darwini TaxID=1538125 RepID=A0AAV4WFK6_9ARAC|nr:hypothetical protein CDAR_547961 [Caerostris darwini]
MQMPELFSLCPAISARGIGAFGGAFSGVRVRRPNGKSTCAGATLWKGAMVIMCSRDVKCDGLANWTRDSICRPFVHLPFIGRGAMQMPGLSSRFVRRSARAALERLVGRFLACVFHRPNGKSTCADATLESVPSTRNHDAGTPKCLVVCAVNGVGRSLVRGCKWSRDSLTLRERGVIRAYANRLINGVIVRGAISRDQSTPAMRAKIECGSSGCH